jgi:DNA primase
VKQAWFDFSSGRNGDIFKFLMETEGLSFPEAVERLAAEAGVELPKMTVEAERHEARAKGLNEVMEEAARYFQSVLAGPEGTLARRYLEGRGLAGAIAREFGLGFATAERFALRDHLAGKGFAAEMMIEAGLLIAGDDIPVPYDRFRDRVMFPIADARGKVIAFGGRAMAKDAQAKYLNSPETPLFHKGRQLFNLHRARKAAHAVGTVLVVEGYVDVIALHGAGFAHAVAPLGTALTEEQLALLWRMADEPILCLDGDKAGRKAADRAIDIALPLLPPGKSLRFALLPEGQDPDDLIRAAGPQAMQEVIAAARPLVDMLWTREVELQPLDTPERRASLDRRLKEALRRIPDEVTRRFYLDEIANRIAAAFPQAQGGWQGRGQGVARQGGNRQGRGGGRFAPAIAAGPLSASPALSRSRVFATAQAGDSPREAYILIALARFPDLLAEMADELAELELTGAQALKVAQAMLDWLAHGGHESEALTDRLGKPATAPALAALDRLVAQGDRRKLDAAQGAFAIEGTIRQAVHLHRRARALHAELRAAEAAMASDLTEANQAWMMDVKARLASLDGLAAESELP